MVKHQHGMKCAAHSRACEKAGAVGVVFAGVEGGGKEGSLSRTFAHMRAARDEAERADERAVTVPVVIVEHAAYEAIMRATSVT